MVICLFWPCELNVDVGITCLGINPSSWHNTWHRVWVNEHKLKKTTYHHHQTTNFFRFPCCHRFPGAVRGAECLFPSCHGLPQNGYFQKVGIISMS